MNSWSGEPAGKSLLRPPAAGHQPPPSSEPTAGSRRPANVMLRSPDATLRKQLRDEQVVVEADGRPQDFIYAGTIFRFSHALNGITTDGRREEWLVFRDKAFEEAPWPHKPRRSVACLSPPPAC